jgi:uncharacterized membrane protein
MKGLTGLFPPTIHPMVVHFPIALVFTAFALDVVAFFTQDPFWERAGRVIFGAALLSVMVAIAAGFISEAHALVGPAVSPLLAAHRRDGVVTGIMFLGVAILRWYAHRVWRGGPGRRRMPWRERLAGMGSKPRQAWLALMAGYVVGLVMITVTGVVGGSMVYDHGLGVAPPPAAMPAPTGIARPSGLSPLAAAGKGVWASSCSRCHGATPPFTASVVASRGEGALVTFISQNMPPSAPVPVLQAKELVAYFKTLR